MAWGFRASSFATSGSVAAWPNTTAAGAAAVSGDRICVMVLTQLSGSTPPTPTVNDNINAGNYTEDCFATGTNGSTQERASIFSHGNSGAGTPSVTVASSGAKGGFNIGIYSGLLTSDPGTDVTAAQSTTSTTVSSGNTGNTTAANELVFGGEVDDGEFTTLTVGGSATQRGKHDLDANQFQGLTEDKDSGTSGTAQSETVTSGGTGTFFGLCAVYKLAATAVIPPGLGPVVQMQQPFHHDTALL